MSAKERTRKKRFAGVLKCNSHNANIPHRRVQPDLESPAKDRLQSLKQLGEVIELYSDSEEETEAGGNEVDGLRDWVKKLQQENKVLQEGLAETRLEMVAARQQETELKEQFATLQRNYEDLVQAKKDSEAELIKIQSQTNTHLDLSKLEDTMSCEICACIMWVPWILPGCGHTFCQSCLHEWLSTTLARHITEHPTYATPPPHVLDLARVPIDQLDRNQLRALWQFKLLQPHYTCPTCRRDIQTKPVQDFSFKSLIREIAKASGESSPKTKHQKRNAHAKDTDPWHGFFGL